MKKKLIACLLLFIVISAAVGFKVYSDLRQTLYFSAVTAVSADKASYQRDFFSDKNVLLFVPHEDDDYNVGSGVIEQYVKNGSDIHICYLTNGDAYGGGELRLRESVQAMASCGVPEEKLIFLGYGDSWEHEEYGHIYNAADGDEVIHSLNGGTSTYALPEHPDFHTSEFGFPADYTRNNIILDIKSVIKKYNPDTILCVDCDEHGDHRAASLFFEEALGELLKEDDTYRPEVFKGFGYCTAWDSDRDYYSDYVLSTRRHQEGDFMEKRPQYNWNDRVRFPVFTGTLAKTEHASSSYPVLQAFASQDALHNFTCIVNSDKVFWQRHNTSLTYAATVSASSGEPSVLNDFKLSDSSRVIRSKIKWNRGVWIPETADKEKKAVFSFKDPVSISSVWLYDNIKTDENVKKARIDFSDGSSIMVENLPVNGSPLKLDFDKKNNISDFSVTILDSEGEDAGLMEVEAYEMAPAERNPFIKITYGDEDDFVYDLSLPKGAATFSVYSYGDYDEFDFYLDDGLIASGEEVTFDYRGKNQTLKAVSRENPDIYDEIHLSPKSFYRDLLVKFSRYIENELLK